MNAPAKPWGALTPDEKRAAVEPLLLKGLTYTAICIRLGAPSRNSISGIVDRIRHGGRAHKSLAAIVDDGLPDWRSFSATEKRSKVQECRGAGIGTRETSRKFSNCSESAVNEIVNQLRKRGELAPIQRKASKPRPYVSQKRFQAKASVDNGATGLARDDVPSDCMTGEASRVGTGRTASATSERMDATVVGDQRGTLTISRAAAWDALPDTESVEIMALNSRTCRWPLWDEPDEQRLFCGAPTDGCSSWCAAHHRLSISAYQPKRKAA